MPSVRVEAGSATVPIATMTEPFEARPLMTWAPGMPGVRVNVEYRTSDGRDGGTARIVAGDQGHAAHEQGGNEPGDEGNRQAPAARWRRRGRCRIGDRATTACPGLTATTTGVVP